MNTSAIQFCMVIPEYRFYSSDQSFRINIIANSIVNIIFAVLSVTLNASVIWVIYSRKRLRTQYYRTLLCLAVTDFAAGLIAEPLYIARILVLVLQKRSFCALDVASVGVGYSLIAVSFFTVSYVTMERFLAVFYPFYYDERCKSHSLRKWITAIWFLGSVYGCVGCLPFHETRVAIIIMVSVIGTAFLFGNSFAYAKIFITSSRIRRRMAKEKKRLTGDEKLVKEANAAKTTCIIVTSLFVFYGPAFITTAVGDSYAIFPGYLNTWAYTFMLINSTANPIVYCYFCRDIGNEIKRLWGCLKASDDPNIQRSMQNSIALASRRSQVQQQQ